MEQVETTISECIFNQDKAKGLMEGKAEGILEGQLATFSNMAAPLQQQLDAIRNRIVELKN